MALGKLLSDERGEIFFTNVAITPVAQQTDASCLADRASVIAF
jgi:hypothetical protein